MTTYEKIGIPSKLYHSFDVTDYTRPVEVRGKQYSAASQNKAFEKTKLNILDDYVFIISVDSNNTIAQEAAKQMILQVLEHHGNPFWFNVLWYGKDFERLRDYEDQYGGVDALVVDGLFAKTNINHVDVLRTLLEKYNGIPIFVVVSGIDGPSYFTSTVCVGYNRFIHFGDDPRKKLKKLEVEGLDQLDDLD